MIAADKHMACTLETVFHTTPAWTSANEAVISNEASAHRPDCRGMSSSSAAKAPVLAAEEERHDLLNFGISPRFLRSPLPGSHRLQASLATLFDGSAICAKKRQVTFDEWPNGGSLKPKCTSFVSYIPTDFMHAAGYKKRASLEELSGS